MPLQVLKGGSWSTLVQIIFYASEGQHRYSVFTVGTLTFPFAKSMNHCAISEVNFLWLIVLHIILQHASFICHILCLCRVKEPFIQWIHCT